MQQFRSKLGEEHLILGLGLGLDLILANTRIISDLADQIVHMLVKDDV